MKHILVECVDLDDVRNKHIVVSSIKDVFDNVEAQKIVDYIKETRFISNSPVDIHTRSRSIVDEIFDEKVL